MEMRNGLPAEPLHELRFASLFHPGRALTVPCDAAGRVDVAALSERLRAAYQAACAKVGREWAYPVVQATAVA